MIYFSFDVRAATNNKTQKTFLEKDDPKLLALMQQAELLSSLAVKVNTEKTDQSLENAWMVRYKSRSVLCLIKILLYCIMHRNML